MKNKKSKIKNQKGFTLAELLVTITIFSLIVGAAIGIFVQALKAQRKALANQELLDQTSYLVEYISRALRMAKKDISGNCLTAAGANYNYETNLEKNRIRFLNYKDICQEFFLEGSQLKERKSTDNTAANFQDSSLLTSTNLQVKSFKIGSSGWDQEDTDQPRVILFLEIEGKEQTKIKIQTTISQRNLDIIEI